MADAKFLFQYLIHHEFSYNVNYKSMKHWKNITLAIPGCDLRNILDDLLELEILSVTIKDFKDIQSSNWFHYHDLPLKMSGDTHILYYY